MSLDEDELFTNVLSKKELEAMIDEGKDDEGLFETVGKAADAVGKTKVGQKIGAIVTIIMLALLSGGANLTILQEYFNGDDTGPIGGCKDPEATNYNSAATFEDGSCTFLVVIYGCTNPEAENFEVDALFDDGSCIVPDIIVPDASTISLLCVTWALYPYKLHGIKRGTRIYIIKSL